MPAMPLHLVFEGISELDVFRFRAHTGAWRGLGCFSKHEIFHITHRTSSQILNKMIFLLKKHTERRQEENVHTLKL